MGGNRGQLEDANTADDAISIPDEEEPGYVYGLMKWMYEVKRTSSSSERYRDKAACLDMQGGWIYIENVKRSDPLFTTMWDITNDEDWTLVESTQTTTVVPTTTVLTSTATSSTTTTESPATSTALVTLPPMESIQRAIFTSELPSFLRHPVWKSQSEKFLPNFVSPSSDINVSEAVMHAISIDVARTLPEEIRPQIESVLVDYARRNPVVGFCQGTTYIVSSLLQSGISTKDSLHVFASIAEVVNQNYYDAALSGLNDDIYRFDKLVRMIIPEISEYLDKVRVTMHWLMLEPMICLMTRLWPLKSSLRVIDVALTEGKRGLFALYLAIFDLGRNRIIIQDKHPLFVSSVFQRIRSFSAQIRMLADVSDSEDASLQQQREFCNREEEDDPVAATILAFQEVLKSLGRNHTSLLLRRTHMFLHTKFREIDEVLRLEIPTRT